MTRTILDLLTENGFAQLQGLSISGSVPLRQEALNEALAQLVRSWTEKGASNAELNRKAEGSSGNPDLAPFLPLVRRLEVRAEAGIVHIDFDIRA
jgi:hypothetical protein